jgi:hypothetical protein
MKDTTFWPSDEQVARLAKSYKPGPGNKGLAETTITQVYYATGINVSGQKRCAAVQQHDLYAAG